MNTLKKIALFLDLMIAATLFLLVPAASAQATGEGSSLIPNDSWQTFNTPTKILNYYSLEGTDALEFLSGTCTYDINNGCWQVEGTTTSNSLPTASVWNTQEVGEDRCWDYVHKVPYTAWDNGPISPHSHSTSVGPVTYNPNPNPGPIRFNCEIYEYPDHQYCLKSYHKAQWPPIDSCNPSSNCILENSFVMDFVHDTTSNPGC